MLTDDSSTVTGVETPAGTRYNIVSGTLGTVAKTAAKRRYGYIYPDLGLMLFNPTALSESNMVSDTDSTNPNHGIGITINGTKGYRDSGSAYGNHEEGNGLWPSVLTNANADGVNAYKLFTAISKGYVTMRSEEDQTTKSYFCRAQSNHFNTSPNPTFVTGSDGEMQNPEFEGNPQTYITTIGLYDNSQNLVAVGRLTKPVEKNYGTEATFKVNLTY
tara:strand:- start:210 stop:860 length:651 start_codon:yes stop_codon:yes gene_type:complete